MMDKAWLQRRWVAYVLLTLTVFFWGSNAIVARGFYTDVSPLTLAYWRWTTACLFLLPFAWPYLRRDWAVIRSSLSTLIVLGALGISGFNSVLYHAAHSSSAVNITLIQTAMPVVIILLGFGIYGERIKRGQAVGVLLGLLGALVTISHGSLDTLLQLDFVGGDLWMVLATLLYALYSVLLRGRPEIHPLSFLGTTFIIGSLFLLPWYLAERIVVPDAVNFSSGLLASVLYIAIFPSILSYLFWNHGVARVGANVAGLFITLMPIFTAVMGLLILGEPLYWFHLAGLILILLGIVLFSYQ
jgi:drug/metabolite transporter (DMT)-like permease